MSPTVIVDSVRYLITVAFDEMLVAFDGLLLYADTVSRTDALKPVLGVQFLITVAFDGLLRFVEILALVEKELIMVVGTDSIELVIKFFPISGALQSHHIGLRS